MKILKTVQRIPGGLMVVPLFLGAIINLLFPEILDVGGMTTATFKTGASSFIGASLMCVGSQITITKVGEPLKRGAVLLLAKFLANPAGLSFIWRSRPSGYHSADAFGRCHQQQRRYVLRADDSIW